MALITFSNTAGTPPTPDTGHQTIFFDDADGLFKKIDDTGTITPIEGGGATTLAALTDVNVAGSPGPQDGDVLTFNSGTSEWDSVAPIPGKENLSELNDVAFIGSPAPADGDTLVYDTGTGKWNNKEVWPKYSFANIQDVTSANYFIREFGNNYVIIGLLWADYYVDIIPYATPTYTISNSVANNGVYTIASIEQDTIWTKLVLTEALPNNAEVPPTLTTVQGVSTKGYALQTYFTNYTDADYLTIERLNATQYNWEPGTHEAFLAFSTYLYFDGTPGFPAGNFDSANDQIVSKTIGGTRFVTLGNAAEAQRAVGLYKIAFHKNV